MSKTIAFYGIQSRDIVFYTASILRTTEKKILVVTLRGEDILTESSNTQEDRNTIQTMKVRKINHSKRRVIEGVNQTPNMSIEETMQHEQLIFHYGIDWLSCTLDWYYEHKDIIKSYDDILLLIPHHIRQEELTTLSVDKYVVITNGYSSSMKLAADFIRGNQQSCMLVIRDICNNRFGKQYFIKKYPDCITACHINEIWLDTYDTYYDQCLELGEVNNLNHLSSDMCKTLQVIFHQIEDLSDKQIRKRIEKLMRGKIV